MTDIAIICLMVGGSVLFAVLLLTAIFFIDRYQRRNPHRKHFLSGPDNGAVM